MPHSHTSARWHPAQPLRPSGSMQGAARASRMPAATAGGFCQRGCWLEVRGCPLSSDHPSGAGRRATVPWEAGAGGEQGQHGAVGDTFASFAAHAPTHGVSPGGAEARAPSGLAKHKIAVLRCWEPRWSGPLHLAGPRALGSWVAADEPARLSRPRYRVAAATSAARPQAGITSRQAPTEYACPGLEQRHGMRFWLYHPAQRPELGLQRAMAGLCKALGPLREGGMSLSPPLPAMGEDLGLNRWRAGPPLMGKPRPRCGAMHGHG